MRESRDGPCAPSAPCDPCRTSCLSPNPDRGRDASGPDSRPPAAADCSDPTSLCLSFRDFVDLDQVTNLEEHPADRSVIRLRDRLLMMFEAERLHRGAMLRRPA